ncbi:DUF5133 domain-containing protein [Streptomyces sp. JJ36]|uniref:DUF5133 domain-containing protein n=1 Tax=Streptomyces sp. JJ36 TaxID=2736645 RepID=UPI001F42C6F3|nr:DUF5133 domain-containing protein [Streptomyces sp. JJ36]MCF6525637.1 DUF5133 domain-containing protein [Streptomyces sp. JJ36]
MLMAHPAVLRELVQRYENLLSQDGGAAPRQQQEIEDVSYTLCVSTGTRSVERALTLARERITAAS